MATGLYSTNDTGWVTPELTSAFTTFDSNSVVRYRRCGDVVNISGQITPTETITASSNTYAIFNLPRNCSPKQMIAFVCQGSYQYLWECVVFNDGEVSFFRYRRGTSASDCPAGAWLSFDCSFIVGGWSWLA